MALKDLAIWNRKHNHLAESDSFSPLASLHREVDRLFDGFFSDVGRFPSSVFGEDRFSAFSPKIDFSEDESALAVVAELPGMEEKDIQVSLQEDMLTIKGEKKYEQEKKEKEFHRLERSFGSFQRSVRVPKEIDANKIKASFKNGVLTITLPKSAKAKESARRIEVKSA